MTKFKYVPKVKTISGKFFDTSAKELQRFISEKGCGYEIIDGSCVPYYDYDKKFDSEAEQKNAWHSEIVHAYTTVQEKFPLGFVLSFDASGFNTKKEKWVNSFHFLVRGVGYYESGKAMFDAVGIDGWDDSVYKDAGKRQLFRMPYCSKEEDNGKRPLKRVFITPTEGTHSITKVDKIGDITDECEKIEDYLVQNVENEKPIKPPPPPPKPKPTKEEKQTAETKLIYPTMIPEDINPRVYSEEDIRSLILCLNPTSQDWEWKFWRDVMWCLRNIADTMRLPKLRELAHDISKESEKYNVEATDEIYDAKDKWEGEGEIGVGSLIMWAKDANPEQFTIWKQSLRQKQAVKKFSGSSKKDHDIELLLSLFSDDDVAEYFVKTQGENYHVGIDDEIYHWETQYWIKRDAGVISIVLGEVIYKAMKIKLDMHFDKTNNEKEYILLFKKINSLRNCKPRIGYTKAIIEKLKRKQFLRKQDTEFDMNPDLICFQNGVYDLAEGAFRSGKKEDFCSNVVPYDWHTSPPEEIDNLMKFINKIMPHEDERDCLLRALSSTLCGRLLEYIIILTGKGRNGKDTLITGLLKSALGEDLYYNNSVSLLTNPNKSGISQEKANMDKKRAVIYAEPGKNDILKCDTLKELTGCPQLNGRGIYSKKTTIQNNATSIIHCNAVPQVDVVDDALANRLVIVPFRALFRTEEKIKEFPEGTQHLHLVDTYYKSREFLEKNKVVFLNILLMYYKIFKEDGYVIKDIPSTMREKTAVYLADSDDFMNFVDEKYERTKNKDDYISVGKDLYIQFKQSDLYSNLTKKEKRKCNQKKMLQEINDNPNLLPFYRKAIYPYIDGKQTCIRNVLIMYKQREEEKSEFLPMDEPLDSDDDC